MSETILLCRVDGNYGGVEKTLLSIAQNLDPERYTPVIVTIGESGEIQRTAEVNNIPAAHIQMRSRLHIWPAQKELAQIARKFHASLIHTFGIRSNTLGYFAVKQSSLPWVIRLPNINTTDYTNRFRGVISHWFNNTLIRRADALQVISPQLRDYMLSLKRPPQRIYSIPNGVDTQHFSPSWSKSSPEAPVIGSTGRLEYIKGYDLLITAFQTVHLQYPNARLFLVGEGSQESALRNLIQVKNLEDSVILAGYTPDVRDLLAEFSMFVCSSRSEGVPNSILEAMAMGLPIVSTRVGGIPSILTDQTEAILIPSGNSSSLSTAILDLLAQPKKQQKLGEAARERAVREFSIQAMVNRVMQMYDEIIKRKQISDSD